MVVCSTDRCIIFGAIDAIVFIKAFAIALECDSAALTLAFIEVSLAINTAFWLIDLRAVLTVGLVKVTETIMELPDAFAVK